MIVFQVDVKQHWWEGTALTNSYCCFEEVSKVVVQENCTDWIFVECFDDSNEVIIKVIISHHLPQAFMPDTVEGFLEVDEVVVNIALVLEMLLGEQSDVENLFRSASCWSKSKIFSAFPLSLFRGYPSASLY